MLHKRVLLLSLLIAGGMLCMADEFLHPRAMPRVLYPLNGSVADSGSFDIIAVAAQKEDGSFDALPLHVDGKAHPWQPYALPLCIARVDLAPGEHSLSLGAYEVMFYAAGPGITPPKDWPVVKTHPGKDAWRTCGLCHDADSQNGHIVLGPHKGCEVCNSCHTPDDVAAHHDHTEAPLRDCASCHAVHGAILDHLLRAPKKQLCAACHR